MLLREAAVIRHAEHDHAWLEIQHLDAERAHGELPREARTHAAVEFGISGFEFHVPARDGHRVWRRIMSCNGKFDDRAEACLGRHPEAPAHPLEGNIVPVARGARARPSRRP